MWFIVQVRSVLYQASYVSWCYNERDQSCWFWLVVLFFNIQLLFLFIIYLFVVVIIYAWYLVSLHAYACFRKPKKLVVWCLENESGMNCCPRFPPKYWCPCKMLDILCWCHDLYFRMYLYFFFLIPKQACLLKRDFETRFLNRLLVVIVLYYQNNASTEQWGYTFILLLGASIFFHIIVLEKPLSGTVDSYGYDVEFLDVSWGA